MLLRLGEEVKLVVTVKLSPSGSVKVRLGVFSETSMIRGDCSTSDSSSVSLGGHPRMVGGLFTPKFAPLPLPLLEPDVNSKRIENKQINKENELKKKKVIITIIITITILINR